MTSDTLQIDYLLLWVSLCASVVIGIQTVRRCASVVSIWLNESGASYPFNMSDDELPPAFTLRPDLGDLPPPRIVDVTEDLPPALAPDEHLPPPLVAGAKRIRPDDSRYMTSEKTCIYRFFQDLEHKVLQAMLFADNFKGVRARVAGRTCS